MSSNDLCEELLVEIFSRLPPKSLLRFRSLSKWSYACIGSPDFIRLHARRSPNKVMIVQDISGEFRCLSNATYVYTLHSEHELPFNRNVYKTVVDYPFKETQIIGSCKGIVCIYEPLNGSITLWNPSIRRKLTIHDPPHPGYDEPQYGFEDLEEEAYFIYDLGSIGFGYDPINDDYKILIIDKPASSFVYSMKTETWRKINDSPRGSHVDSCQCCFNGALYCVVTSDLHLHRCYIMRFDLSSEVFTMTESPQLDSSWETRFVTIINGRLALAVMSDEDGVCRIWVRIEEDVNAIVAAGSWSAAFTLKLDASYSHSTSRIFQLTAIDALLLGSGGIIDLETHVKSWFERLDAYSYIDGVSMFTETLGLVGMGSSCNSTRNHLLRSACIVAGVYEPDVCKYVEGRSFGRTSGRAESQVIIKMPSIVRFRDLGYMFG